MYRRSRKTRRSEVSMPEGWHRGYIRKDLSTVAYHRRTGPSVHESGTLVLVVNQGTIRCAEIVGASKKLATAAWDNSQRHMERKIDVTSHVREWLFNPNKRGLKLTSCTFDPAKVIDKRLTDVMPLLAYAAMQDGEPIPAPTFDTVGGIMAYESGELDTEGTLKLFSHLIKTGMAWTLQGSYGRMAQNLINSGMIDADGTLHEVVS